MKKDELQKYVGRAKGVLTIVEIVNAHINKKHIDVKCVCSICGKETITKLDRITTKVKLYENYCQHCKESYLIEKAKQKYIGKTNGTLTCIDIEGYKYEEATKCKRLWVRCVCSVCGSETIVRGERLTTTAQIPMSCTNCYYDVLGQATHRRYYRLSKASSESDYRRMQKLDAQLSKFKAGARQRNLEWSISDMEAYLLMMDSCYYCGCNPSYGIDRIDSSKGYIANNIISCCGMCNIMKNKFSQSSFLQQVHKIYNNLHLEGSTTISKESTLQANGSGNGGCPEKGNDIV